MNIAACVEVRYSDSVPFHVLVSPRRTPSTSPLGAVSAGQRFLSEQPAASTRTEACVELLRLVSSQTNHFCWKIQGFFFRCLLKLVDKKLNAKLHMIQILEAIFKEIKVLGEICTFVLEVSASALASAVGIFRHVGSE